MRERERGGSIIFVIYCYLEATTFMISTVQEIARLSFKVPKPLWRTEPEGRNPRLHARDL